MQKPTELESLKDEVTLQINSYDKPEELSEVQAWSQLLLNLIFLRPGTYPSMPGMGVGIENYQYDFIDEALTEITQAIIKQQQTYLPDVPLSGVNATTFLKDGHTIIIIQLNFNLNKAPGVVSTAIAIDTHPRNFLNFDISW